MNWALPAIVMAALGLSGACARHVVVERDQGRVDSARSISTSSDRTWSVTREPKPAQGER